MLISGDRNSQRRAGNICTKILQYVQDFSSPQNDELSMKVTKTIKKLQFIKWTWACSPSTMLVNIWLLSAFTDSVSRLVFVHFWKLNAANSIFLKKKILGICIHYIPLYYGNLSGTSNPRKKTLPWASGIMV